MSPSFHASRIQGQSAAYAASTVFLAGTDYANRCRPTMAVPRDLRGASLLSEFFERIYERDRRSPLPEVADADPAVEALDLLLVLQSGWDGRKAPPPSSDAIRVGRHALALARSQGLVHARVTPDIEGGVAVYFFGGGSHSDGGWNLQGAIMVSNEDEATLYLRDRSRAGADVTDIGTGADDLSRAVERIRQFVVGS